MTDAELKRVEKDLRLKLPAVYVSIMRKFPDKLHEWPATGKFDHGEWFFSDIERILEVNKRIRRKPGEFVKSPRRYASEWPENLFVFGRCAETWHVFDVDLKDPPMLDIKNGRLDLEGAGDLKLYFDLLTISHKEAWQAWKKAQAALKLRKPQRKAAAMTDADFKQLEEKLGLKLPVAYRKVMRDLPAELHDWPPGPGETANRRIEDFLLDVVDIVKAQKGARKRLGRALPPHSFVFGRTGDNFWLIDAQASDPPVKLVFDGMVLDGPENLAAHLERVKANHKEAWAKARRRTEAGAAAILAADALVAEGRRLARPAVLLAETGKEYAAVWKGTGVVPPPEGEWEHWVSLDTGFLPENPRKLRGVLSVYVCREDGERYEQVGVVHDPRATLPTKTDGRRLFAKRIECVPPIEALFKFGSKPIQDWLQANSVEPGHGYNPRSFSEQNQAALKAYEKLLTSEHPFYANADCFAMLGGWSWCFMWCYGIVEGYPWDLFEKALIVLTVRDEEPWLEVYDDGKNFVTFSRIT